MSLLAYPIVLYVNRNPGQPEELSLGLVKEMGLEPLIKNGDWKAIEQKLLSLPDYEFSRAMDGVCRSGLFNNEIETYIREESTEFRNLVAGVYYIYAAWEARTGFRAEHVTDDQWAGFFQYLELAEEELQKNFSHPNMVTEALSYLITVNMGQSERELCDQYFQACMDLNPNHLNAHLRYFQVVTEKWLGSDEELEEYVMSNKWSPEISTLQKLRYYIEIYKFKYFERFEDEEVARNNFVLDYQDEVSQFLKTVRIPKEENYISINANNFLTYLFVIVDNKKARNMMMKKIAGKYTLYPWAYFGIMSERAAKLYKLGGIL